ncbi:UNVERIFIED_CONTAM: hypothetical protein K2H54_060649 [Gekko kuhli]
MCIKEGIIKNHLMLKKYTKPVKVINNEITSFNAEIYIDENGYWDFESIANGNRHNFSGILNIHCANPDWLLSESAYHLLSENLSKRLTDVYNDSPALGRYFISAKVISVSLLCTLHPWFSIAVVAAIRCHRHCHACLLQPPASRLPAVAHAGAFSSSPPLLLAAAAGRAREAATTAAALCISSEEDEEEGLLQLQALVPHSSPVPRL